LETSFKNNCKERKHAAREGALWWYPELDKLRQECNNNIRWACRNLIDKETAKTARKRYKSTIRQCKRESWRQFCRSVSGPRPASRLFRILGKDQIISLDNIQVTNSSHISNTEEILRYLLDTHFPGNTLYGVSNSNTNYQASEDDWQIATTIVTEKSQVGNCLVSSLQISRYRRNISCPFAKRNRRNNRNTNKILRASIALGYIANC